jgi:arylsulfatase A-like enzyme
MRTWVWVIIGLTALAGNQRVGAAEKPNVIVILSDDQGWGDLSLHGNTNLRTPNLDAIGTQGAQLERFYVCPVCSPTRAEFLTGRYHPRAGVWNVTTGGERLNLDEKTIADTFRAGGYATAIFGKWHNGSQYPYHPLGRGFKEFYGFTSGHWGDYFSPPLEHNDRPVTGTGYLPDDLTNHAVEWIGQKREKPFFCYLAYNTPHSPMQVPDRWYDAVKTRELKLRATIPMAEDVPFTRAALAMVENLDWNVGRVLAKIDEMNLAEKTIVVFFNDNGPNGLRWNGGLRGRKGSTDEGGVRSPCLIRWKGQIPAGVKIPQVAGAIDLHPTLADLAGIRSVSTKPFDGRSLAQLLKRTETTAPDRLLFSHWGGAVSVRNQQYGLDNQGRLYDLQKDPGQTRDLAKAEPETAERLREAVAKWKREVVGLLERKERPYTVGYPEFPRTTLPARDGTPMGQVKRSARAPNCSFFTNWTRKDDRMVWPLDVATTGEYDVEIWYTCPKADVGSRFALRFGEQTLEGKVSEAHDPPLRGDENDRASRGTESLVKDFKPMSVGRLRLEKGTGTLTLQALEVAGKQVMDVRAVVLTLRK